MLRAKIGVAPIAWWNDDLEELSDDVSLEECLRQAATAGFGGMETGRRFPMNMAELGPVLDRFGISVCGGWFSGRLLDGDLEADKERVREQLDLFIAAGAPCLVYGETARSIQGDRARPLATRPQLDDAEMATYGRKVTAFAEWCAEQGMPIAYHHHMGAAIESEADVDAFVGATGDAVGLVVDTGHLAMAGGDAIGVIDRHHQRIRHVHAKDVRRAVIDGLDRRRESFLDAVIKGAFTVPGDGDLDFARVAERLAAHGYQGWFVVEAEQDPKANPPQEMAKVGHTALLRALTDAGYRVDARREAAS